jgi:four helix bundle protein
MRPFRNLLVWQRAHQLTKSVYATTQDLPESERFGLTSQARRSAVSIPSNIAEGAGRSTDREFARFIDIAASSASELEYQLFLASELGLLGESSEDLQQECREIRAMLSALRRTLLRRPLAES